MVEKQPFSFVFTAWCLRKQTVQLASIATEQARGDIAGEVLGRGRGRGRGRGP
jgi:hypothetical protein